MLIDKFCEWWGVGTPAKDLPTEVDLIGLVSFGATKTGFSEGTKQVLGLGIYLLDRFWQPPVVSGEFTGNPVRRLEIELKSCCIPGLIKAGQVISTIEEAKAWNNSVPPNFTPKTLVIATDEMHSRSARRVSNRIWNGWWGLRLVKRLFGMRLVQVLVVTFPTRQAIDSENPMTALRSQRLWVRNNVLRECFLMFVPFGYTIMKRLNIHQPIATDRGGE